LHLTAPHRTALCNVRCSAEQPCAVLCCAVLCCAVLCCAVLCCAVLCCAALRCAALRCAVLCCAVLCCAVLCCAVLCGAVRCGAVRCCAVRCGAVRCGAVRCGAVQCCAVLCCAVLCCGVQCTSCNTLHSASAVRCTARGTQRLSCGTRHSTVTHCRSKHHKQSAAKHRHATDLLVSSMGMPALTATPHCPQLGGILDRPRRRQQHRQGQRAPAWLRPGQAAGRGCPGGSGG
jgi:hypothetical protein